MAEFSVIKRDGVGPERVYQRFAADRSVRLESKEGEQARLSARRQGRGATVGDDLATPEQLNGDLHSLFRAEKAWET